MQISASILDAEHLSVWPKRSRGFERRCKIRLLLELGIAALAQKGANTMKGKMFTRRRFMAASAAASTTTMIAAPFVKTAHAAGKLSIGFWDHFVPDANKTSDALIQEWAAKEKVEVQIDRFTGNKALITLAAEAQAKSGHDTLYMTSWLPHAYASSLEPVDDVMIELIKQNGPVNDIVGYLGRTESRWLAVPATIGNQIQGPCSRIDLMKHTRASTFKPCTRPAPRRRLTTGHSIRSSRPRRRATRPDSRLGSGSERRRIRLLPPVSSSSASAPCSSMPTGRSRSRATPCARRSTIIPGLPGSSRPTRQRGTTPPITSGSFRAAAR